MNEIIRYLKHQNGCRSQIKMPAGWQTHNACYVVKIWDPRGKLILDELVECDSAQDARAKAMARHTEALRKGWRPAVPKNTVGNVLDQSEIYSADGDLIFRGEIGVDVHSRLNYATATRVTLKLRYVTADRAALDILDGRAIAPGIYLLYRNGDTTIKMSLIVKSLEYVADGNVKIEAEGFACDSATMEKAIRDGQAALTDRTVERFSTGDLQATHVQDIWGLLPEYWSGQKKQRVIDRIVGERQRQRDRLAAARASREAELALIRQEHAVRRTPPREIRELLQPPPQAPPPRKIEPPKPPRKRNINLE